MTPFHVIKSALVRDEDRTPRRRVLREDEVSFADIFDNREGRLKPWELWAFRAMIIVPFVVMAIVTLVLFYRAFSG